MSGELYIQGLYPILLIAGIAWVFSTFKRDVGTVDTIWPLMFLLSASVYVLGVDVIGARALLVYLLLAIWALRLAVFLTWRHRAAVEDGRYRYLRDKYSPHFTLKSLFVVFGVQALLAWTVSLPLLAAMSGSQRLTLFDNLALVLWGVGLFYEAVADFQLARFKAQAHSNQGVLQHGLWRYSRHPNYFGEACVWWAFYLFTIPAGYWWTIVSPIVMTLLLLKVSGVALQEKTITERRPEYKRYQETTNAFFPGPRR